MDCDWLVAADGADSAVRPLLGLTWCGAASRDHFLMADVLMQADFPVERLFWFDPPFHTGLSALMHRQADNVWRVDLQLGGAVDPEQEQDPERVMQRLRAMLGEREFELVWASVYTFTSRRLQAFRHGRILFAGDAAHQVSPFGARGANSGIQDAENLAWKLHLVIEGRAPDRLIDSYGAEREPAADENIRHSMRSSEFISPAGSASRHLRDAVLLLAQNCPFARRLVNSGRLSTPSILADSPLNTPDRDTFAGELLPGAPAADAPVVVNGELRWLLQFIGGQFVGLYFAHGMSELPVDVAVGIARLTLDRIPAETRVVVEPGNPIDLPPGVMRLEDYEDFVVQRYDASPGSYYLMRPDQHVCARWRSFDPALVRAALLHATCNDGNPP
jgi:3-(3-hydroxy-phenyl)propionate hydroxylase